MIGERWLMDTDGVDTNDTAPASRLHTGQYGLAAEESGFHRVVDLLLPGSPGRGTEAGARQRCSIVVDQDIHLAKGALCLLHHGFDLRLIANICLDEYRLSSPALDLVQHLLRAAFVVHLIEHYPCAFTYEYPGDAGPCPTHGAGDERYFAV